MAGDYQTEERMALKLKAVPLPNNFTGQVVLDIGCDHGFWTRLACEMDAMKAIGLDRGRMLKDGTFANLAELNSKDAPSNCEFREYHAGKQYHQICRADFAFMMSVYHHIYESAGGDHNPVWFWAWKNVRSLIFEGPFDTQDGVVALNVSDPHKPNFTREKILDAAGRWFDCEYVGPALHVGTREVWRMTAKEIPTIQQSGEIRPGAGGASKAFEHENQRRIDELEYVLGQRMYPGSLNLHLDQPFDWSVGYYRTQILDLKNRSTGLQGEWAHRWARIYPIQIGQQDAWIFRFEGEKYADNFVEILSPIRLRDRFVDRITLTRRAG